MYNAKFVHDIPGRVDNALNMFLTFESLKPYVLVYFVHIKNTCRIPIL